MGFPTDFFPVLFAIPRVSGWLAHWHESIQEKPQRIWRPRQVYTGEEKRAYVPMEYRNKAAPTKVEKHVSANSKRSRVAGFTFKDQDA